ncbi:ribonuclease H-like domain-containing protein [Tanacetum coccineum]|uniref:Ribonuclease H-like domain-containing protein n=1 Tax=Tanacetum coccineum TaxID=301880 RepID=A0ABQ4XZ90_9ASTR
MVAQLTTAWSDEGGGMWRGAASLSAEEQRSVLRCRLVRAEREASVVGIEKENLNEEDYYSEDQYVVSIKKIRVSVPALTKDHRRLKINMPYPEDSIRPRTPQKNGVAERRNRTLIKAIRTMLADSKLPTIFWAEAVNNACYVQNRVLVVKPHNKTPYELFHGRTPTLSFMRPFECPVTILNTIDHLRKFDGKADEGFFVGYSLNSKAFRVFNSRTRIVEENLHIRFSKSTPNVICSGPDWLFDIDALTRTTSIVEKNLHIRFSESTPNVVGSGPDWIFDIDALTRTMNYEPIVAGTQSNGFVGTKACDNAGQARKDTEPVKNYILLPLWTVDPPFSQDPKSSHDDGSKPLSDDGKKVDEDPRKEIECKDQEKEDNVNNTNNVNAASTNEVNAVGGKTSIELLYDPNMPALEDVSIFNFLRDDDDVGAKSDINNLDTTI